MNVLDLVPRSSLKPHPVTGRVYVDSPGGHLYQRIGDPDLNFESREYTDPTDGLKYVVRLCGCHQREEYTAALVPKTNATPRYSDLVLSCAVKGSGCSAEFLTID